MRNHLTFGLVLLLASQAGACVIYDDGYYDDGYYGDGYYEPALITTRWQFTDLATQTQTACPAGFDTVAVNTQGVDSNGRAFGPLYIDLFDCDAAIGTIDPVAPDIYETWTTVTNTDGTRLYATSTSSTVDLIDFDATVDTEILNDGGYFALDWKLAGATSNAALSCSQLGNPTITLGTVDSARATVDEFACADLGGVTGGFVAGDYTLQLTASSGESNLGEPVTLDTKTILNRNRVTDLGLVTIPIANR